MANIKYIPPLGEEYQHQTTETTSLLHTDVYLLFNMANFAIGERIADGIIERANQNRSVYDDNQNVSTFDGLLKESVPDALPDDTLSDYGRFDQGLNASKRRVERKLKLIDDYRNKLKTDEEKKALDGMYKNMRTYLMSVYGDESKNDDKPVKV